MSNYWENVSLDQLTAQQWESLCDGCGKCCLHKIQDEESDEVFYTDVACQYLGSSDCRCSVYSERLAKVENCIHLSKDDLSAIEWLPETCAYRLRFYEQPLPSWHHLVSGSKESIHLGGESVANKTVSEKTVADEDLEEHIIHWVD